MRRRMATKVWRGNPDVAVAALERDGVRYKKYDDLAWHKAHEGAPFVGAKYAGVEGSYGNTAMSPRYVREHGTGTGFEVANVAEGVIDRRAGCRRAAPDIALGGVAISSPHHTPGDTLHLAGLVAKNTISSGLRACRSMVPRSKSSVHGCERTRKPTEARRSA